MLFVIEKKPKFKEKGEKMTIEEAKAYIGYCIKEGCYSPEDFEGWTDKELIEFAEKEMAKADYYADRDEKDSYNFED